MVEVLVAREDDDRVQRAARSGATELLERSRELEVLGGSLAGVSDSRHGQMVLVGGEAGIGKTALLRAFCDEVGSSVRVLWAACDPLFTPRPLGPLLDLGRVTDGELRTQVERGAKPHDVAAAVMRELALPAPTVMVLEDLHWADEATLDVVRLVSRRVDSVPVLFVASYRDDELDRAHPLRSVLGQLPSGGIAAHLALRGLSRAAVAELAVDSSVNPDQLYDRTVGNPFFVTEVLAAGENSVPVTVRDAVLARTATLSPVARTLLDAVAIVPQHAEMWLLDALTDSPRGTLEECLRSGMLRADAAAVAFRHELARLAVEESLAPDWRLELHRSALAALIDGPVGAPDLARLSYHAEAAMDPDAVLRFAPAAGEHAASVGAHREAGRQYERALRFASSLAPEARADLLERSATEDFLTDMRHEAVDALGEALAIHRARGDLLKQGEMLRFQARIVGCMGRTEESRTLSREAVQVLEQAPPGPELARAYAGMSGEAMEADDSGEAIAWGRRAIALAERVDSTEALIGALNYVGTVELAYGNPAGQQRLERSLKLAMEAGKEPEAGVAYINLAAALGQRRRWRSADAVIAQGVEYCRERGLEAWVQSLAGETTRSELAQGRWDDATETARSLLESAPSWAVEPRQQALIALALVRARRRDPESWPLLDEALEIGRSAGDLQYLAPAAVARAEAVWLEGRADAIASETDDAYALAVQKREPSYLGQLALWRWRAGLLTETPTGADEVYRLQIEGNWRGAAEISAEHGCRYDAALALADSHDDQALRQAHDELRGLGATAAAAIVARRLRERGARGLPRGPRRATRANPAGLTQRELEVLPLLADGLRNAEIAARLVISEKTVDHHVSAILRKLDVHTRAEAGAKAGSLALTGPPS